MKEKIEICSYYLENEYLKAEILNYGAILRTLEVRDKNGKFENILLNFSDVQDYIDKSPYFGSIVGRFAGRIEKGRFNLNGREYNLDINLGENCIHGGHQGLSKKIWKAKEIREKGRIGIELEVESPDGECGFPGNVKTTVRYILKNNSLIIEYEAGSDKETILNMTNHAYFNLSGNLKRNILDHELFIEANEYIALKNNLPFKFCSVDNTVFDFKRLIKIKDNIFKDEIQLVECKQGYDHPFKLERTDKANAVLIDRESGRKMEVFTDQNCLVLYTASKLREDYIFNGKVKGRKYLGVCLEAQDYPDLPNFLKENYTVYSGEKKYIQKTEFKFSIIV